MMGKPIDVLLITGFLGSGKTTFLRRIVDGFPRKHKLMVLMNEFGEIGIDGQLIKSNDLEMLEISKGSIFCVCVKTDFIRALATIANDVQPEVLVIEATGAANPESLLKDLSLPVFKECFQLKQQICIIDAENFMGAYEAFVSVEKQIESSSLFLINKIDLAEKQEIEEIEAIIAKHHPHPLIHKTTFANIPLNRLWSLAEPKAKEGGESLSAVSFDVDLLVKEALKNNPNQMIPPDKLHSAVFLWKGDDRQSLQQVLNALPSNIIRVKGFISLGTNIYLLSRTMATTELIKMASLKHPVENLNHVVLIGAPDGIRNIEKRYRDHVIFTKLSSRDPLPILNHLPPK